MPNYYAHLCFGQKVLPRLSDPLQMELRGELAAFQAGLFGPDPLFFYQPLKQTLPRAIGLRTHHEAGRVPAERLWAAVRAGQPQAAGYAAGFLCHFALDSACHGYVEEQAKRGLSHTGVESELDRALMEKNGVDPLHTTPLPDLDLPDDFFTAAVTAFPGVAPEQFREALKGFAKVCRLQTRAAGTWLAGLVNWVGGLSPKLSPAKGVVLTKAPDPARAGAVEALLALLEGAVEPTAERLEKFFTAGPDLNDGWYDRDFYGAPVPAPAGV